MIVLILMTESVFKIMINNVTELVIVTKVMFVPVAIVILMIVIVMSVSMIIMSIILFVETVVASQRVSWLSMVHVVFMMMLMVQRLFVVCMV